MKLVRLIRLTVKGTRMPAPIVDLPKMEDIEIHTVDAAEDAAATV